MIVALIIVGLLVLVDIIFTMICIGTAQQSRNEIIHILQNLAMQTSLDDARIKELEKRLGLRIY